MKFLIDVTARLAPPLFAFFLTGGFITLLAGAVPEGIGMLIAALFLGIVNALFVAPYTFSSWKRPS